MENQVENKDTLNVKGIILILGTIFGGILSLITTGGIPAFILGASIGLVVAVLFISFFLPHKSHDR